MGFIGRYSAGFARRITTFGLQSLNPGQRAEFLQMLVEDKVTVIPIDGANISMYTPFPGLIYRSDALLTKEKDTIAWIDGHKVGSVFWDIGANIGAYSLYAAIKRHSTVLAFEPASTNLYALNKNIRLNNLGDRVRAYCIAFSNSKGLGVLNLSSDVIGAAANQFGEPGDVSPYSNPTMPQFTQGMLAFAVDDFIEQFAPPFPNHLKLDVDGIELAILSGARKTLNDPRLESVMVELSVTDKEETGSAVGILEQAGFELVAKGEIQGVGEMIAANHLFRRTVQFANAANKVSS